MYQIIAKSWPFAHHINPASSLASQVCSAAATHLAIQPEMDTAAVLLLLALVVALLWYPLLLPALPPSPPALFIWIPVLMLLLLFAIACSPTSRRR
jgi:hypothetical protein